MALALNAVVKAGGALWSRIPSSLKWCVYQTEEPNSTHVPIHGHRRHEGRRQIDPRALKDWRSDVSLTGVRPKQTGYTSNQRCPQTNPSWWSQSISGWNETSNLGHSGNAKKASAWTKKCVTCLCFNSGSTQQLNGDLPSSRIEAPERAFSCVGLYFAGPLTFKNGTEGVKCYIAVFISGSSSRGKMIIDVTYDGGSPKTIHCKTSHP